MSATIVKTFDDTTIPILDMGYIKLVEYWGSDQAIVEDARQSTDGSFRGWGPVCRECAPLGFKFEEKNITTQKCKDCGSYGQRGGVYQGDEKFLEFLWSNKHSGPFEGCGAKFEIMAPIMVFREWHRHRTQSYNEMSARYVPLPDINYVPSVTRCMLTSTSNKQAQSATGAETLTEESAAEWLEELQHCYARIEACYKDGIRRGIPKELARLPVPVGRYSKMRANANLLNWLRFLALRADEHAQWEIRSFAIVICQKLAEVFPYTMSNMPSGWRYI